MEDKQKDWLFRIFLTLSLVWAAVVFWLLFDDQYFYSGSSAMKLNEVGDFLAGSFSPLAFFWLAYGYWMQNKELKSQINQISKRNNIEESRIEEENSKKDLEKKRKLFDFYNSQPKFEMSVKEAFDLDPLFSKKQITKRYELTITCINMGKKITSVIIKQEEETIKEIEFWPRSTTNVFNIYFDLQVGTTSFLIDFYDINGIPQNSIAYIGQDNEANWQITFDHSENMRP